LQPSNAVRLGLDIDGTITLDPKLFVSIAEHVKQSGGEVHIVTSRSEQSRVATLDELQGYRMPFDAIYFLRDIAHANDVCPYKSLDWFQRYLWQKVAYAILHRLTNVVDDDPKVLALFATYAPDIEAISAMDRIKIVDPQYERAVRLVVANQQASIALVQRYLKLGYARAVRLMEAMETAGIIGEHIESDGYRALIGKRQPSG
jgi:DNA segregation ATPase FtsK/SpoIIIE-like protein